MKKYIFLLIAACASLLSCSKNNSDTPVQEKYTPVIEFSYAKDGIAKTDLTMVLTVDGKEYKFDQVSDNKTINITSTSGTIKLECLVDETKQYTELKDAYVEVKASVYSISEKGHVSLSSYKMVDTSTYWGDIEVGQTANVLKHMAESLNTTVTYSVDSQGIITLK